MEYTECDECGVKQIEQLEQSKLYGNTNAAINMIK